MLSDTTQRTELHTASFVQHQLDERLKDSIAHHADGGHAAIERRLRELDSEWNIERMIETEAPTMIGLGIALGALVNRKWFAVSAMAASMVIVHSIQGWYPLLPLFRRLGVRTQQEIEQERMALKALRGDHNAYQADSIH